MIRDLSFVMLTFLLLVGCETKNTKVLEDVSKDFIGEHTSQNSLDWMGTYEATLPCADCPGIKTIIKLNDDNTFEISNEYLERNSKLDDSGEVMWHDNGSVVHLKGKDTNIKLKVIENGLIHLDQEGNEITGEFAELYRFKKI